MSKPLFTVSLSVAAVAVLLSTGCAQPSSSDRAESRQSSGMQRSADPATGLGRVASQDQRTAEMDDNPTPGMSPTPAPSSRMAGNSMAPMADASGSSMTGTRVAPGALDNSPSPTPSGEIGAHPATTGTMPSTSGSTASNNGTTLPASDGRNSNTDAYRSGATTTDGSNPRGSSAMAGSGTADAAPTPSAYGDNDSTMRSARSDRN